MMMMIQKKNQSRSVRHRSGASLGGNLASASASAFMASDTPYPASARRAGVSGLLVICVGA